MPLVTPQGIKLTYEDYVKLPDDGNRHEILDGVHYVSAAPVPYHQQVVVLLTYLLCETIHERGLGRVYCAPIDVELSPIDIVQPDLVVVKRENLARITETRILGAPDLAIEVLSPSTAKRDRHLKKDRYRLGGVREYWIVDPKERRVERHVSAEPEAMVDGFENEIPLATFPDLVLDLTRVW